MPATCSTQCRLADACGTPNDHDGRLLEAHSVEHGLDPCQFELASNEGRLGRAEPTNARLVERFRSLVGDDAEFVSQCVAKPAIPLDGCVTVASSQGSSYQLAVRGFVSRFELDQSFPLLSDTEEVGPAGREVPACRLCPLVVAGLRQ